MGSVFGGEGYVYPTTHTESPIAHRVSYPTDTKCSCDTLLLLITCSLSHLTHVVGLTGHVICSWGDVLVGVVVSVGNVVFYLTRFLVPLMYPR